MVHEALLCFDLVYLGLQDLGDQHFLSCDATAGPQKAQDLGVLVLLAIGSWHLPDWTLQPPRSLLLAAEAWDLGDEGCSAATPAAPGADRSLSTTDGGSLHRAAEAWDLGDEAAVRRRLRLELDDVARKRALQGYEIPRNFILERDAFSKANYLLTDSGKPAVGRLREKCAPAPCPCQSQPAQCNLALVPDTM